MNKAELEAEIIRLQAVISDKDHAFQAAIQGGLEFKHRFEKAYRLLKSIKGINDHTKWVQVRDFIDKFDTINTPTYGDTFVPKKLAQIVVTRDGNCRLCWNVLCSVYGNSGYLYTLHEAEQWAISHGYRISDY